VAKYVSSDREAEVVEVVDTIRGIYDVVPVYEGQSEVLRVLAKTYTGDSIPRAARAPHPNRRRPVLTIMYGLASLRSPPGIGDLGVSTARKTGQWYTHTSCPKF
jgi:hypothetical protein